MTKPPSFCTYPTKVLLQLSADIETRLIQGDANNLEIDTFFYIQFELAERLHSDALLDPRD